MSENHPTEVNQQNQMVNGPQTNIAGDVHGPVLSGQFHGPVVISGEHFAGEYEGLLNAYIEPWPIFERVRLERFVGRQWVADAIDNFLQTKDRGVFVLEARAGLGKTTFLAHLVKERGYIHHFVEMTPGMDGVIPALRNLAAQLITNWRMNPDLPHSILPGMSTRPDFLQNLLFDVAAHRDKAYPQEPIVLVIDALDEASSLPGQNVLGLPKILPKGVYLIVSQRPVDVPLRIEAPRCLFRIESDAEHNISDVQAYLKSVAVREPISESLTNAGYTQERFIEIMQEKCNGVWIYLHYIVEEIERRERLPLNLENLPSGLWQYYAQYWQKWRERDSWYETYLPLISVLTVAQEPLSYKQLCSFAGLSEHPVTERVLREKWRPFLRVEENVSDPRYYFYHASLREFMGGQVNFADLTEAERSLSQEMGIATKKRHQNIVDYYTCQPEMWWDDNGYAFRHLHIHRAAVSPESLYALIESKDWLTAQQNHEPTLENYARGVDLALRLAEQAGTQGFSRFIAYILLRSTIGSLATSFSPGILEALVYLGQTKQAISYASLMVDPVKKVDGFLRIDNVLSSTISIVLAQQILDDALCALAQISDEYRFRERITPLAKALANRNHFSGLRQLLKTIDTSYSSIKRGTVLQVVKAIIQAHQLENLPDILEMLEHMANPPVLSDNFLMVFEELVRSGYNEYAQKLLIQSEEHAVKTHNPYALARIARFWREMDEEERANRSLDESLALLSTLSEDHSKAQALLELSKVVHDDRRSKWLHDAVERLQFMEYRSFRTNPIIEIGQALAIDGNQRDLETLAKIIIILSEDRGLDHQGQMEDLSGDRGHDYWQWIENYTEILVRGLGLEFLCTLLNQADWPFRSRITLKAISGISIAPNRADVDTLLQLIEQMDDDDPYFGNAVEALTPLAVQIDAPMVVIRLADLATAYAEPGTIYHHQAWNVLAPAMLQLNLATDARGWWAVLGKITREDFRQVALLEITKALTRDGFPHLAIEVATSGSYSVGYISHARLASILAKSDFLDVALELLDTMGASGRFELSNEFIDAISELTVRAADIGRLDILERMADIALIINDTKFFDVIAPLLAQSVLKPQARSVIEAYKRIANVVGDSEAESQGHIALIDMLSQAHKFDVAKTYIGQIQEQHREQAIERIVYWMSTASDSGYQYDARKMALSIRDKELQAQALGSIVFGLTEEKNYAAIEALLDVPGLTWHTSHAAQTTKKLVSRLLNDEQFEIAARIACKITDSRSDYAETWKEIVKSACEKGASILIPGFIRQIIGQEATSDCAGYVYRYGSWFAEMVCLDRAKLRLEIASVMSAGNQKVVQGLLSSALQNIKKAQEVRANVGESPDRWELEMLYCEVIENLIKQGDLRTALGFMHEVTDCNKYVSLSHAIATAARKQGKVEMALSILRRIEKESQQGVLIEAKVPLRIHKAQQMSALIRSAELAHQCGEEKKAIDGLYETWRLGSEPLDDFGFADEFLDIVTPLCRSVTIAMQLGLEHKAWEVIKSQLPSSEAIQGAFANRPNFVEAFEILLKTAIAVEAWDQWEHFIKTAKQMYIDEQVDLFIHLGQFLEIQGYQDLAEALFRYLEEILEAYKNERSGAEGWLKIACAASDSAYLSQRVSHYLHAAFQDVLTMPKGIYRPDYVRVNHLLEIALRFWDHSCKDKALSALSRSMDFIKEEHIGYSKCDVWPKLIKILGLTRDEDTLFQALLLVQYITDESKAENMENVVRLVAPVVVQYPDRCVAVAELLLQQACEQGRSEVWKCIKAFSPILFHLGGGDLLIETWERIKIIESLFQRGKPYSKFR